MQYPNAVAMENNEFVPNCLNRLRRILLRMDILLELLDEQTLFGTDSHLETLDPVRKHNIGVIMMMLQRYAFDLNAECLGLNAALGSNGIMNTFRQLNGRLQVLNRYISELSRYGRDLND
ncbi:uncharacterized protein LOC108089803 [Drosophila ficusphila]|uniref:uncharacterized protein LOC108089803 n=1 Tax=Drosophila ficusphila TaxID=30025 RepID=UPI0007E85C3A|nr:uncharacterized protein LOC108089803 [Drosophila ficusphila]